MEKNKKGVFIFFTIVIILFAVGGYFFGKRTAETENLINNNNTNLKPNTNPSLPDNTQTEPTEEQTTEVITTYEIKTAYSNKINNTNYELYFRNDNTFRLRIYGESGSDYVGTYEVNGNTVTFKTAVLFESNGCFFTEGGKVADANNFEKFTGTLANDNITIVHKGNTISLNYNSKLKESSENLTTYSINPKNGQYTDCTYKIYEGYSASKNNENYELYLRSDNTFRLRIYGESGSDYVGTYEKLGNTVTFKTTVLFQSNGCFFKKGAKSNADVFKAFTGTLNDKNITIQLFNEKIDLEFNSELEEDSDALKTYSVNPKNGTYSDCTDNEKI